MQPVKQAQQCAEGRDAHDHVGKAAAHFDQECGGESAKQHATKNYQPAEPVCWWREFDGNEVQQPQIDAVQRSNRNGDQDAVPARAVRRKKGQVRQGVEVSLRAGGKQFFRQAVLPPGLGNVEVVVELVPALIPARPQTPADLPT